MLPFKLLVLDWLHLLMESHLVQKKNGIKNFKTITNSV